MAFTKHLGPIFLPTASDAEASATGPTPAEAAEPSSEQTDVSDISLQEREKFKKLLTAYYEALSRRAVKDHTVGFPNEANIQLRSLTQLSI